MFVLEEEIKILKCEHNPSLYGANRGDNEWGTRRRRLKNANRTDISADKFPGPQPPTSPIQAIAPPSAMQICRRTFTTSVGRLSQSAAINSRPSVVRCAQILQANKNGGVCRFEDQEIKVNGVIRSVRKQKRFAFAEISDGSTVEPLQAILKPAQAAEYVRSQMPTSTRLSTKAKFSVFTLVCQLELQSKYRVYGRLVHQVKSKPTSSKQPMLRS